MFRIAASPARSHDTWSLAATTTERSEIVVLIAISLFFSNSEFCSLRGSAPGVFEPCWPCAVRDTATADNRNCSRNGVQRQRRFERPHIVDKPAGLVSRRSTGYNGGW